MPPKTQAFQQTVKKTINSITPNTITSMLPFDNFPWNLTIHCD
jgi:hypothetical protein